jgi:hypothetical protein
MSTFKKNPDEPIRNHKQDRFGRAKFAEALAEAVVKVPNSYPFTVGLYGSWGSGKTSIINLVIEYIGSQYPEDVVVVKFNPWLFSDAEKLHMAFFSTLATSLGKALPTKAQAFGKELEKYSQLTGSVNNAAKVMFPHIAAPLAALSKVSTPLYNLAAKRLKRGLANADDVRNRVNELLIQSGKRVVVIVDDIDRLDSDEIHQMFKLVKNTAHFSNVSYLLAFDPTVVSQALASRYPQDPKISSSFIDKIVQLPLDVPYVQQGLINNYLLEDMDKILKKNKLNVEQDDISRFQAMYLARGADELFTTPRKMTRYLNMVDFSIERLKNEASFTDIVLVDMIRSFFPDLRNKIVENREIMLGKSPYGNKDDANKTAVRQLLFGDRKPNELEVALIRELFPTVEWAFGGSSYGDSFDKQWESEQRVCSMKYFDRYFAYDIPPGDIADNKIESFLDFITLPKTTQAQSEKRFRAMLAESDPALLISKLRTREDSLSEDISRELSSVVLAVGGSLAKNRQGLVGDMMSPNVQSAILGVKLTKKLTDPYPFLERFMKSVPVNYAAEMMKWIEVNSEDKGKELPDALLNTNQIEQIGKILASRIKSYTNKHYIPTDVPEDAQLLMHYWKKWGNIEDIRKYHTKNFKADPKRASEYLMTTIGKAHDMMTGRETRTDLRMETYNSIATFIDPEVFVQPLISLFGDEVNQGNYSDARFSEDKKSYEYQIAQQFLSIHRSVTKDSPKTKDADNILEGEIVRE